MSFDMLTINHMDNIIDLIAEKANSIIEKYSNIIAVGVSSFGPYSYSNGSIVFMDSKQMPRNPILSNKPCKGNFLFRYLLNWMLSPGPFPTGGFALIAISVSGLCILLQVKESAAALSSMDSPLSHFLGNAFEFGHIIIDMNGEQCKYGCTGCLETFCDLPSFLNHIREVLPAHPDSLLTTQKILLQFMIYWMQHIWEMLLQFLCWKTGGVILAAASPLFSVVFS